MKQRQPGRNPGHAPGQRQRRPKIRALVCTVTDQVSGEKGTFVLLQPKDPEDPQISVIDGSITCSANLIKGATTYGTLVEAYNIHRVSRGWRAGSAVVLNE